MNTLDLLNYIKSSDKFLVSAESLKFIDECKWVHVEKMVEIQGKSQLSDFEKKKLGQVKPLALPISTHSFYCPIENKKKFIGLYYYDIDGWIINSAAIYYIVNFDIEIPNELTKKIKELV